MRTKILIPAVSAGILFRVLIKSLKKGDEYIGYCPLNGSFGAKIPFEPRMLRLSL